MNIYRVEDRYLRANKIGEEYILFILVKIKGFLYIPDPV
jgi:hypothetical protein